jgi:hypothetical protein
MTESITVLGAGTVEEGFLSPVVEADELKPRYGEDDTVIDALGGVDASRRAWRHRDQNIVLAPTIIGEKPRRRGSRDRS